ncbi:1-acyl-sn-glycerol-3-phosphate acyltransferase [Methylovulum psychrotolerans]|jgi:1-acyl-sn-glycerol-3-phosphate acyltransferase|uniref:lysophospholipid acyltransferase family protein n=1 Tax=Methylovulum psychrotolerans TaxID=1704499 RepID=UPI001BFF8A80|nr:lysophospholipid acyltransferase family protein [Methylovulum psychrotolerans]MBT9096664.1 1-acyl-sn-glycerol-3-phosphate acyltransferase [Methylovulum psychrotolerans]
MKSKSRLYYKLLSVALLAVAGCFISGVIFPTLNLVCPPNTARDYRDALKKRWLCWFSAIVKLDVTLEGAWPEQPGLIVSNHVSWLDIILLGQYLPAYFVAKSDIASWPIFGFMARQSGTIFIRRGEKKHVFETAEQMVWLLKQHRNIFAFPEGTTTRGDDVAHFHASLFQAALLTKVPVQPVAIQYLGAAQHLAPFVDDDDLLPHLINMLKLERVEVRLSILPLLDTNGKTRQAVSQEARGLIRGAFIDNLTAASQSAHS